MTTLKMIASANGLEAIREVFPMLKAGATAVEACVAAATIVENDPEELTVGYGGLPNCDGVVELDAAVMDGRTRRAGGVAAMQGIRNPTQVAKLVMERTRRVLLAGDGARQFALSNGFLQENLLSETARRLWMFWKRSHDPASNWVKPSSQDPDYELALKHSVFFDNLPTGTVHFAVLDGYGNLACATSTSGHAFKIPGRVGDSPIVGAGLYADNAGGTCGSVGRGETNLENLTSFAIVRRMRNGESAKLATVSELQYVREQLQPELFDSTSGRWKFDLRLFVLSRIGEHFGICTSGEQKMAVADSTGVRHEVCEFVE